MTYPPQGDDSGTGSTSGYTDYSAQSGYGSQSGYGEQAAYGAGAPGQSMYGQTDYSAQSAAFPNAAVAQTGPPSNAGWAVASLLFFWPLSFIAMSRALQVYPLWAAGRHAEAEAASASVKKLGIISIAIVAVLIVLYFVFIFAMVALIGTADYY